MMRKNAEHSKNQINVKNKRCLVLRVVYALFFSGPFVDSIGKNIIIVLYRSWWLEEFNKFDQTSMFVCYCSLLLFLISCCCYFNATHPRRPIHIQYINARTFRASVGLFFYLYSIRSKHFYAIHQSAWKKFLPEDHISNTEHSI